jgi:hypothetical protein
VPRLDHCSERFKSFTARKIIDYLEEKRVEPILERLRFAKLAHKTDLEYQFWQEGSHTQGNRMKEVFDLA